jgi:hypothetical protein
MALAAAAVLATPSVSFAQLISLDFDEAGIPEPRLLISLDFDEEGTLNTQSDDVNADNGINVAGQIFSGQNGAWNSLEFAKNWADVNTATLTITDMLDGDGNATTVDFTYNTGGEAFSYRQLMYPFDGTGQPPLRTDHFVLNDAATVDPATSISVDWEISGLTPGGVYDLILFGQSGPANESTFTIFGNPLTNDAEFDGNATGIVANPDGKITGTHEAQGAFDSWDGLQIQDSAILNTQSGDVNADNGINVAGQIFSGQNGAWNSLAFAKNWPDVNNATLTITDMSDGDGNATTVDFTYNTGGEAFSYRQLMYPFDGTGQPPLRTDHFVLNDAAAVDPATSISVDWEISGLTPGGVYDLILFGQSGPANESTFTIFGNPLTNDAEFDGNATGIVANPDGKITGTHEAQGLFDSWDGLQIQKQATSPKLLLSGASVTINPSANLKGNTGYYVQIDPGAIDDNAGNSFVGVTDTATWSFTTAEGDVNEPAVVTLDPANGATDASRVDSSTGKSFLALTFDEDVRKGAGAIVIRLTDDDTVVDTIDVATVTVSGAQITIVPNVVLPPLTSLYVEIDPGAFLDLAGNSFAGISGSGTWNFTTDDTPSSFGSLTPFTGGDAGEGLDLSGNIVYAFNLGGILGTQTVQGVDFLDVHFANPPIGITTTAGFDFDYTTTNGGNSADYGDSADDDALENIITYIWYDNHWTFDLAVEPGTEYRLQLILQEGWNGAQGTDIRNIDISVETASPSTLSLGVDDLVLGMETNGTEQDGDDFGLVYTYTFTAADSSFRVAVDEATPNTLGVLTAVILEQLTDEIPFALNVIGNGSNLDFEWNSRSGMRYHLVTSTDLTTPVNTWPVYDDGAMTYEDIPATGTTTMLTGVLKVDPIRFFALIEEPVPPLFSEDFEEGIGGFTIADHSEGGAGTDWAQGDPMSGNSGDPNIGGFVDSGVGRSTNCVGTDIGAPGFFTADTDTSLRSGVIDLTGVTGATLSFAEALDFETGDTAVVNIIDDTDDNPATNIIASEIYTATDGSESNARWSTVGPIAIPVEALGQAVRIEWRFTQTGFFSGDYMGWYIDNVLVTETKP